MNNKCTILILITLTCYQTITCGPLSYIAKLNIYSLKDQLKEHKKAFDAFEPEAPQVKVKITRKDYYNGDTEIIHTYEPNTAHLVPYLSAYKKLVDQLSTIAIVDGVLTGIILGSLLYKRIPDSIIKKAYEDKTINKIIGTCCFLASILPLGIIPIALENKIRNKVPYFDPDNMNKHKNLFNTFNLPSIERMIKAGVPAVFIVMGAIIMGSNLTFKTSPY